MSRRPASPARPRAGAAPGRTPRSPANPGHRPARTAARATAERDPDAEVVESRFARVARLLSVRALVLSVVLLAGFTLVLPTVRAYLAQQAQLDGLAGQVAQAQEQEEELAAQLARWDDPAYVAAQARERLSYVLPGETPYRVIDPEVVQPEVVVEGAAEPGLVEGPTLPVGGDVNPWYATVWESVRVAGEAEVAGEQG